MSDTDTPETHIYIESSAVGPIHVCRQVYVNGTPVLLAEDGIEIEYGVNDPTVVTLSILPKTVTFGPAARQRQKEARGENPDLSDCPSRDPATTVPCELPHHHDGPHQAVITW